MSPVFRLVISMPLYTRGDRDEFMCLALDQGLLVF
jgi:hypothetical protein